MMGKQLINICKYVMVFALAIALVGCDENRVFDQNTELIDRNWDYENALSYEVEIADTNLRYNVYVNLRHTNQYTNSNLWILLYTTFPSGEKLERRVELPLASKEGKWYGNHSGSIVNHQIPIQENAIFPEKGTYHFEIEQNMRRNPLDEILNVGLRIEKVLK